MEPITITLPSWDQICSYYLPPESTDDVIIFPLKSSSQKFSRKVNSTKITQGKASPKEINDVLTVLELVFGRVASTREFLMGLVFSFYIPYLIFMSHYWFYGGFAETMRFGSLVFAFIAVTYSLYKRMRETGRRKVDMQRMIEMIRPVYAKRGLTWYFSENFFCCWLELKRESSTGEQNSTLSVEVHSDNNQKSFINQQDSNGRIFEEFKDEENIIICAGKNLTGPDFSPPVQFQYVIYFIIYGYIMISWMNSLYSFSRAYYRYY